MSKKTASGHGSGMSIHGTTLPPSGKDGENQGGLQSWRSAGVLANILWSVGWLVRRSAGLPASLSVSLSLLCMCARKRENDRKGGRGRVSKRQRDWERQNKEGQSSGEGEL